jgi:hypothetical protein
MKIGILGSGFGLYGYLPATHKLGYEIFTLERYRSVFEKRIELDQYSHNVVFMKDEDEITKNVNRIIVARDSVSQSSFIQKYSGNFEHIYLEKPMGVDATDQRKCRKTLSRNGQSFSIGYLFPFTEWYDQLLCFEKTDKCHITITWRITPQENTWKIESFDDSGLFSYYAIHFVPLLYDLKIDITTLSIKLGSKSLLVSGKSGENLQITLRIFFDTTQEFKVQIMQNSNLFQVFENKNPFGAIAIQGQTDNRVGVIINYLESNSDMSKQGDYCAYESLSNQIREIVELQGLK